MKRTIKIRGKSIKSDKWISGVPVICRESKKTYILETAKMYLDIEFDCYDINEVYQGSVGQYTGLKDKNGVEIYEGDIVEFDTYCDGLDEKGAMGIVEFIEGGFYPFVETYGGSSGQLYTAYANNYKIIGNIYENPELKDKCE